jgi:hypothetical protein
MLQNNITTTTESFDIPSICLVKGCNKFAQIYSTKTMNSKGKNQYLKTCCRHTWRDLLNRTK